MYMYLVYMYMRGHAASALETRVLAREGGGSESSEGTGLSRVQGHTIQGHTLDAPMWTLNI